MTTRSQKERGRSKPPALRHPWLYAIPTGRLPERVTCGGRAFVLVETFKHDFFAATGLYRDAEAAGGGLAVLKLNRIGEFLGVPLRPIGRLLARREIALYRLAQDLPGAPALLGAVGDTGFMHTFVPGHPLGRYESVSDTFFDELLMLLSALHARDVAYVDLNKRQNILVGDDGRPYLIDFQISLHAPSAIWWGRTPPARWLLRRFQHGDIYHVLKHKRRLRPDLLTADEAAVLDRLSIWIRLHRAIARPLTHVRRAILRRLHAGRTTDPEVAGSGAK